MSQLAYSETMTPRLAGQLADAGLKDARTFVNEEAAAGIRMGCAVVRGTGVQGAKLPALLALAVVGVALHSHGYDPETDLNADGEILPEQELSVLRRGRVSVYVENACNPGDKLCIRAVAGAGGTVLGKFRKTAVTAETTTALDACEVVEGTSGAGIAVIEFDAMKLGTVIIAP